VLPYSSAATPSQLVLALGKDGNFYLVNRNNLGGIVSPVAQAHVGGINRGTSAVTYHTSRGAYFDFHNDAGGAISAGVADPGYSLSRSSITFSMPLTTSVKRS
jgi:hypothetical protein